MGHEYVGIVEEVGAEVETIKPGQFVVGSFFASDNTCEICQAGYQSSCVNREAIGSDGAQAELLRVPLADGTLVATPDVPADDLIPELPGRLRCTRHWLVRGRRRRGAARARPLPWSVTARLVCSAVLAAKQLGAERIIAMSRHEPRQQLAREYGATDIVTERGDDGVARDQGTHRRVGRPLGDRGGRHPGVDDAGHPLHPRGRARRLRRRRS